MLPTGSPSLVGYLRIGNRRVRHQHLKEPLPALGQAGHRVADDLVTLAGQQALVDLGGAPARLFHFFNFALVVAEHDPLVRRQAAEALIPRGRREPGAHAIGVLDSIDVLEQAQPCGLGDVSGVALRQLEFCGNGPDEPRKLIDEALPRLHITSGRMSYQQRDVCRIRI